MSWRTNAAVLKVRNLGRKIGFNHWASSLLAGDGYEARYDHELRNVIRRGDCVWDVGANVGHYTRMFAERVGNEGAVFAFEPSPMNFQRLVEKCSLIPNVSLLNCGLGRSDGKLFLAQGGDELGATSRVIEASAGGIPVEIRSGDSLVSEGRLPIPNVIKIDVEGFEWAVLEGFTNVLCMAEVRVIGIEVHFGILREQGLDQAPRKIESQLRLAGFRLQWPDSSHLLAVRNG